VTLAARPVASRSLSIPAAAFAAPVPLAHEARDRRAQLGNARGRPVGVAFDSTGALLVADDTGNTVWRVTAAR